MWVGSTDRGFKNDQADQWLARVELTVSLMDVAFYALLFRSAQQQSSSVVVCWLTGQKRHESHEILNAWKIVVAAWPY